MIIFDLDGTLADCEHRRHFVEKNVYCDHWHKIPNHPIQMCDPCKIRFKNWKPDWKSFYEACDKDIPIEPVIEIWNDQISLGSMGDHLIWSGRCESVRDKTEKWLSDNLLCFDPKQLKMRPIGDSTPDDVLKEKWLDEYISKGQEIKFVFDDRPKVIRMWRRRGIFVFNCCQHDEEF